MDELHSTDFEIIRRITVTDLLTEENYDKLKQFLLKGDVSSLRLKLAHFRHKLHDLLLDHIINCFGFPCSNDIDAGIITGIETEYTPDLYNEEFDVWADVTITGNRIQASEGKFDKYKELISKKGSLSVYCFDINDLKFYVHSYQKNHDLGTFERQVNEHVLDEDISNAIKIGLTLFKSASEFEKLDTYKRPEHPQLELTELCPEAQLFFDNDFGILSYYLNNVSYDSDPSLREETIRFKNKRLTHYAKKIAEEAKTTKTNFKPTVTEDIKNAFLFSESQVREGHKIILSPKPSCHGKPGFLRKIPKSAIDTRDFVVQRMMNALNGESRLPFLELMNAFIKNESVTWPNKEKEKKALRKLIEDNGPLHEDHLNNIALYHKKCNEQKWDRESLDLPRFGHFHKAMHIGEKDYKVDFQVKTVPFWDDTFPNQIKHEIMKKSNSKVPSDHCWTPHKEYKPKTKEAGGLYNDFIQSELYQELASVGQLASNVLRLVTKARSLYSITTCQNENMAAIVGPGDCAMNEAATIPIVWVAMNSEDSAIWMPTKNDNTKIQFTDGDRLTKARLEQMVDSPRIASIAASIVSCELRGKKKDLLYACGILSAISMSINIRDSELIDHIRYMVPNIFSERSCSVEYIREKYNSPLKTGLQALVYQETKKTLISSADLIKEALEVDIENDEVVAGGTKIKIPFLNCEANTVFQLNGIVYTGFFSCKKGLHNPRTENKKMFDKICEYEHKSYKNGVANDLVNSSFEPQSYHFFNAEYVALTMHDLVEDYGNVETWRSKMSYMDNLKKPYQLSTFSSLRSSLKSVGKLEKIRMIGMKSKLNSKKAIDRANQISNCYDEIWSDERTRVVDHFFDVDRTILEQGIDLLIERPLHSFYSSWDQKRQRTGRDREVFILDPNGKVFMHNVESLFKIVCEGIPHELITLPGNKKIISMKNKGAQYFKKMRDLKRENIEFEHLRMTEDMTKWAPGDNVCKFIYAIAGLPFLTKNEKIWYINFLCTSLRKKVIMNAIATEAIGAIAADGHILKGEMWTQMLGSEVETEFKCTKFSKNYVNVRFNWLMGVLNDTSSAVHAACAGMLKKVMQQDYQVYHYSPDVHSDDAAVDIVVSKNVKLNFLDYFAAATTVNLKYACIKLSDKKSYIDYHRKEFVSEVDDNGIMRSYWHKQAIAAISGLSYIDFFRDISEGCSKVANLISLGSPPTVYEVTMGNVVDLARDTYSMQPGMWNDVSRFVEKYKKDEIPLELGGPFNMNPILLPIVGLKYQTFSKMMNQLLDAGNVDYIDQISDEKLEELKLIEGNLFSKVWVYTAEVAVKEGLILDRLDPGIIRFKQFSSYDKTKNLRVMKELQDYSKEYIEDIVEKDPTIVFRQSESIEEQQLKLAMLIKNPAWYSSATLQSQGALKLDRMFNVRTPCCAPIADRESSMQKGMKTIREAIGEAIIELESRKVTLYDVYHLLKSLPLLCYVYDVEKNAEFRPKRERKRTLYPVQKQAFMKDGLVESSVVGLLQYIYTGDTKYSLDRANLDREIELVKMYQTSLSGLDKIQQAVAIYKIFQQTKNFSSVFYVPSTNLRGYKALMGLLGNQFSDLRAYVPKQNFKEPENKIYERLKLKEDISLESKCSEYACFLVRVCSDVKEARRVFRRTIIDGVNANDFTRDSKSTRELAYAQAMMGYKDKVRLPGPFEVVWMVPQYKTFRGWLGDFLAYINVGTKNQPKGLFIEGMDEMIHRVYLIGVPSDFPNLKSNLNQFASNMRWKGSLHKHMKITTPDDPEEFTLELIQYGSSFQCRIQQGCKPGLAVFPIEGGTEQVQLTYDDVNSHGFTVNVIYKGMFQSSRALNQRMTTEFPIETSAKLDFYPVQSLWERMWISVASGHPHSIDDMIQKSKKMVLFLSEDKIERLQQLNIPAVGVEKTKISYEETLQGKRIKSRQINTAIFHKGTVWNQMDFSVYLSLGILEQSTLTSWISLKGYLRGLVAEFSFFDRETLEEEVVYGSRYSHKTNYFIDEIYKSSQRKKRDDVGNLKEKNKKFMDPKNWGLSPFEGRDWMDLPEVELDTEDEFSDDSFETTSDSYDSD